jgi:hypothetical protein
VRGLLPCTRTRLWNRAEPVTGKHFRSYSRTRRFNSARTSGSCNFAALSICCDAIRVGLLPLPVLCCTSNPRRVTPASTALPLRSCSFRICRAIIAAFASPLLLPARFAITTPPSLLLLYSLACISAARTSTPSYFSSSSSAGPAFASALPRRTCAPSPYTPSQHPPDGVLQSLSFSCCQHFVEHLKCVLDIAIAFLHLAQQLSTATPPARAHVPRCLRHRRARLLPLACPILAPFAQRTRSRATLPPARRARSGAARAPSIAARCASTRALPRTGSLLPPEPRLCV